MLLSAALATTVRPRPTGGETPATCRYQGKVSDVAIFRKTQFGLNLCLKGPPDSPTRMGFVRKVTVLLALVTDSLDTAATDGIVYLVRFPLCPAGAL